MHAHTHIQNQKKYFYYKRRGGNKFTHNSPPGKYRPEKAKLDLVPGSWTSLPGYIFLELQLRHTDRNNNTIIIITSSLLLIYIILLFFL